MKKPKPMPERFVHLSRDEIEDALSQIADTMKGPLPNIERALLYADRVDLRAALERK